MRSSSSDLKRLLKRLSALAGVTRPPQTDPTPVLGSMLSPSPQPRSAPAGVGSPTKRLPGSRPITGWRKLQLVCRMIPGPSNAADSTSRLNVNLVLA